jgi:hypothetical protein
MVVGGAPGGAGEEPPLLRLDPETIEAIASRLAELLAPRLEAAGSPVRRRLLSAAEVSEWWGVERSWVYEHAEELGAIRLGTGRRPRLRFDPDLVAHRLAALAVERQPARRARRGGRPRSPRMPGDAADLLPLRGDPELRSATAKERSAGRRANAPGRGAEDWAFGAMSRLAPPGPVRSPAPIARHGVAAPRR